MSIFNHNGSRVGHIALATPSAALIGKSVVVINANIEHFCRVGTVQNLNDNLGQLAYLVLPTGTCVVQFTDGEFVSFAHRDLLVVTL